jgi:hypothetical protein
MVSTLRMIYSCVWRGRLWVEVPRASDIFTENMVGLSGSLCCYSKQSFSEPKKVLRTREGGTHLLNLKSHVLREGLAPLLVEFCALLAQRFTAGAFPQIFLLDIVARIAICVIVMNGLFYRVPGRFSRHRMLFLSSPRF